MNKQHIAVETCRKSNLSLISIQSGHVHHSPHSALLFKQMEKFLCIKIWYNLMSTFLSSVLFVKGKMEVRKKESNADFSLGDWSQCAATFLQAEHLSRGTLKSSSTKKRTWSFSNYAHFKSCKKTQKMHFGSVCQVRLKDAHVLTDVNALFEGKRVAGSRHQFRQTGGRKQLRVRWLPRDRKILCYTFAFLVFLLFLFLGFMRSRTLSPTNTVVFNTSSQ